LARKSRRKHILLLAVLCCGMVELSCGGGGGGGSTSPAPGGGSGTNGTPKGTYTLTVTATSGSLTHTTQVVLTVQ
jgi:trimeric autotransporter adhesin